MAHEIVEYRPGEPKLRINVDGYEVFGMTLSPIEASHRQWLAEILDRAFTEAIDRAVQRARAKDQAAMRKLMGLP